MGNDQRYGVTVAVLAGGRSSRLGRSKALERLDGVPLLGKVASTLSGIGSQVLVVTSEREFPSISGLQPDANVVLDIFPDRGVVGGVHAALTYARTQHVFVCACDMPLLNASLIEYLLALTPGHDAVVPMIGDLYQPLHAVYSKTCIPVLESMIRRDSRAIWELFRSVRARQVREDEIERFDPDHLSFLNINTEEDLTRARAMERPGD